MGAGCGSGPGPTATPGSLDDVLAALVLQDVTILHLTSGDPGCPASALHSNAVHLVLVIGAQSASHDVYLLRWRDQADYDAAASLFSDCTTEYGALHNAPYGAVVVPPWRAYGPFWTAQLETIVVNALSAVPN